MVDIKKSSGKGREDKSFHYTKEEMVKDLLDLIEFEEGDIVLDVGSGKNKVWYNNFPNYVKKLECEIEDGCDFLKYEGEVDWCVGNPPYKIYGEILVKSSFVAKKGIAFLMGIRAFNTLTPRRLEILKSNGFELVKMVVVGDKRWFGRYFFLIFEKNKKGCLDWKMEVY